MCDVFALIPGLIQSPVKLGVFLCPREGRPNEPGVSAGQKSLLILFWGRPKTFGRG